MKTEDKNVPRVRIAVLGNINVGKSALTVRYLTRRFIGEYRSNTDLLYRQTISLDSGLLDVEIVDISVEGEADFPLEQIQWADACLIVYSITDKSSFDYASKSLAELKALQNAPFAYLIGNKADLDHLRAIQWADACLIVYSITDKSSFDYASKSLAELKALQNAPFAYLIGNKADLDHLRAVSESEGAKLAASYGIGFCEVSVAENSPALYKAFERILSESRARPVKQRKFSVSKMIGTLIGSSAPKPIQITQGTVVPCHKGDLHKSRVLKRRQAFAATISL
uniref:small monomeric GTPase n=1 Tax=Lutzomyia longipalpis TaxID=7200 RepID=A0A1B0EVY1_LUTLO